MQRRSMRFYPSISERSKSSGSSSERSAASSAAVRRRRGQNGLFQLVARKAAVARLPGTGKLHGVEIGQQRRVTPRVQHVAPAFCLKF